MNKEGRHPVTKFFLGLHPLHRLLLGAVVAAVTFLLISKNAVSSVLHIMAVWIVFSAVFVGTSWVVLIKRSISEIKQKSIEDDGSKTVVFIMILLSSIATMFTVLLLILSREEKSQGNILIVGTAVCGMLLSWIMVHTIFTFHYAHMFYEDEKIAKTEKGLDFPGKDEPDYFDFAYFSFVIGCTFQVSDVQVRSRKIRRLVMLHGLLSFALNTFVVALTINIIAGLK